MVPDCGKMILRRLPFTEKASPEVIERELGISKAAFKRAVGRLLKQQKIMIQGGKIRRIG